MGTNKELLSRARITILWLVLAISLSVDAAESLTVVSVPTRLPRDTRLGAYSPVITVGYSGLREGQTYTLRVWLLSVGSWFCASTQWCKREIALANRDGTNGSGEVVFDHIFDVYDYALFDWVFRLYDTNEVEIAFAERYASATANRAPVLDCITDQEALIGDSIVIDVRGNDPDGNAVRYTAENLPPGSTFDTATARFDWTPTAGGTFDVLFSIIDDGEGELEDSKIVRIRVPNAPTIVEPPLGQLLTIPQEVTLKVRAVGAPPLRMQWFRNNNEIEGATNNFIVLTDPVLLQSGQYHVVVSNDFGEAMSETVPVGAFTDPGAETSAEAGLDYLRHVMDEYHTRFPIYDDLGSPGNHFHARGKIPNENAPVDIVGGWPERPHSGATSTKCTFRPTPSHLFGGFYFLNGLLAPGTTSPSPYFGTTRDPATGILVNEHTGIDISGATTLSFWCRGEKGGEQIDFFFGGVGWNSAPNGQPIEPFPDSLNRVPPRGEPLFVLSTNWQRFEVNLKDIPRTSLTNVMGGFGWVAASDNNPDGAVFYLDDIQFDLNPEQQQRRLKEPRFLRSFSTASRQRLPLPVGDFDFVLRNTSVIYDNALAVLAFLSSGKTGDTDRAMLIGDAFLYAQKNDRILTNGSLRSVYAAGDIGLPPGWLPNGRAKTVPIPGFFDEGCQVFYELTEAYTVDAGNNAWTMIALLALHKRTHEERYLEGARLIGAVLRDMLDRGGRFPGFRGGYGSVDSSAPQRHPWSSSEHNLDAFAAFMRMYALTEDDSWKVDAEVARSFMAAMWDPSSGCFSTGTLDPDTISNIPNRIPLDVHAWYILTAQDLAVPSDLVRHCAEANHFKVQNSFSGFDFNDDQDGVWFEGTAQMALAYAFSNNPEQAERYKKELRRAQFTAPFGNFGGISAAAIDGLSTGFFFSYFRRLHVGATAWNIFAQRGFNPYYQWSVGVLPKIETPTIRETNMLIIPVSGQPGAHYSLEISQDLVTWRTLGSSTNMLPRREFSDVLSNDSRFYRAVLRQEY